MEREDAMAMADLLEDLAAGKLGQSRAARRMLAQRFGFQLDGPENGMPAHPAGIP